MRITGSLQKNNGYWCALLRIPTGKGNETKQKSYNLGKMKVSEVSKADAQAAFEKLRYELQEGIITLDKDSFVAYADKWLEHKKITLRTGSYQAYRRGFDKYIVPFFTERKAVLQQMKPQDVQDFADYLIRESGLSAQTAKKYIGIIRGTFDDAEKNDLVKKNPAKFVELPPDKESNVGCVVSPEDVRKLLEASKGHPVHTAIFLAAFLGLRRSEILGLRWENIDLEARTLFVCETTTQVYGAPIHEAKTKSKASRRLLHLSDPVFDFLKDLRNQQRLDKLKHGAQYIDNDFVCKAETGKVYQPQTITENFGKTVSKSGIKKCRLHDLRHTAASLAIESGVPVKEVQVFLGHSQMSTTTEIYAHVSRAGQISAADTLSAALTG